MVTNSKVSGRRRRSSVLSRFVPQLECLESREVLSVTQDAGGNVIVTGTPQPDTVLVAADTPTTVRVRFNGTDFGPFILTPVNQVSVSTAGGSDTITVTAQGRTVTVDGGAGANTLVGPDAASLWNLAGSNAGSLNSTVSFSAVAHLRGGSGNDSFRFAAGAAVAGTIDGGGGNNAVDYSALTTDVIVNLATGAATGVNTHHGNGIVNIQSFLAGSGLNRLLGTNADTTWNLSGSDAGSLSGGLSFAGFGILGGGAGNDQFAFAPGASVSRAINGGAGVNRLDYSALSTPVVVNLSRAAVSAVHATQSQGILNVQSFVGGSGVNRLLGADADTTWNLSGSDAGTLSNGASFSNFGTLGGGAGNDTFGFAAGARVSGVVNGGDGNNTLDYTAYTTNVVVSLASKAATGIAMQQHRFMLNIQAAIGGSGLNNTLFGDNTTNTWTISEIMGGVLNGSFPFTQFHSAMGGTVDDTFVMIRGIDHIDGGGGNNWLDYSNGGGVTVDLAAGSANGIGRTLRNVQHVIGSPAGDEIMGDLFKSGGNILIGGSTLDRITAGAGRSLVIGSDNGDILVAANKGDILIAGTTIYDGSTVDKAALLAILDEWKRTDADYATRVSNLRNGTGLSNGHNLALGSTVFHDDRGSNDLLGAVAAGELDWFFAGPLDSIQGIEMGEQTN